MERWRRQLGKEVGRLGGRGGLCAGSSRPGTQAASKIYLYSPLEFLSCLIIVLSKRDMTGLGSHHYLGSPSPAFLCHLPDYKEFNSRRRETAQGFLGGGQASSP